MAASKQKAGTRPLVLRSGTRLDHRLTRRVFSRGRHVGYFDRSLKLYQFGGELERFFMRIYDALMLGENEWRVCEEEGVHIEYVEEPGSGNCWFTSVELAREHGAWIETPRGTRYGIRQGAFDIYSVEGALLYQGAQLHRPKWVIDATTLPELRDEAYLHEPDCERDEDCLCRS